MRGYLLSGAATSKATAIRSCFAETSQFFSPSASFGLEDGATGSIHGTHLLMSGAPRFKDRPNQILSAVDMLSSLRTDQKQTLSRLCGAFALAWVDPECQRVCLAIDPMGIERIAYSSDSDGIYFDVRADDVASLPTVEASVSSQRLYDFLFFHMIPAPVTVFENVRKLEAGTLLTWTNGNLDVSRYWQPKFQPDRNLSEEALAEELRGSLLASVQSTQPDERTGAFLSGGLDSSTVSGYLSRTLSKPPKTFSIGFGVPEYDELEYARIANAHFDCRGHEYVVEAPDIIDCFSRIAEAYDEPFGNSSAVPTLLCAELAKRNGVDHLLAGDGGDELFAGNERYAKQKVFEFYQRIPGAVRAHLLNPAVERIATDSRITPLRKLKSYVEQARIPLPERLETWNFAYREGISLMLDPEFSSSIDPREPVRQMETVFGAADAQSTTDRLLAYDWHFTLADSDLRKVSHMCKAADVKVSFPMLDHRLVDLALRVPPEMKLPGFKLRNFFKSASKGFLPEAILNKPKHGFGLPFGALMKSEPALAEMIYARLQNLKQRGIFQAQFIDQLIADQQAGHAAYFGYFVWDLAILEEWLHKHSSTQRK